jgi:hypothetical protein
VPNDLGVLEISPTEPNNTSLSETVIPVDEAYALKSVE